MNTYDVFNERAQLISGSSITKNRTECLFYAKSEWRALCARYGQNNLTTNNKILQDAFLRPIRFVDYNSGLRNLVKSVNDIKFNNQYERGGGIYFNWRTHTVSFHELKGGVNSRLYDFTNCLIKSNVYGTLIGIVHTHPEEEAWLAKGYSDQSIFDAQYSEVDSDGKYIQGKKFMLYSIGNKEVDFYSPMGEDRSKNGLCKNDSILNGSYNLLKHALQMYGRNNALRI